MKQVKLFLFLSVPLLFACGRAEQDSSYESYKSEPSAVTESASMDREDSGNEMEKAEGQEHEVISSIAAMEDSSLGKQFIRKADLRFRVPDVRKSTLEIEDITRGIGGFVESTHLASSVNRQELVPVSRDSSLETIFYEVSNTMKLRVPNYRLDSTLRVISRFIDYLDYRTITAEDVSITIYANELVRKRYEVYLKRMGKAIDERGKKLRETGEAEVRLADRGAKVDQAMIENLRIEDQIKYSTISLTIYQRENWRRTMVVNHANTDDYQPGFGYRAKEAFNNGWNGLKEIFLFFLTIWPLFLIGGIVFYVVLLFNRKQPK